MADSFYWHDYETFGTDPSRDRPVQFAGLRTDLNLQPVGDPLVIYARPAGDVLPNPQACLITGISPLTALAEGIPEYQFIARIHRELAEPGTCTTGYNSIRFDDEVTRYTLYRNFYDPYAREWQNGNSRWDIIDMVRTAYALRPEGINWPRRDDGFPSFRLEQLTEANGIAHTCAHDALSDVEATIALARLVRQKQPKLFDYLYKLRNKRAVQAMLDIAGMKPVLHVSGMFGAEKNNIALIVPLLQHPDNNNEVICYDLMHDPAPLFDKSPTELASLLFSRAENLPASEQRPGLKSVHLNRCPVLAPAQMADAATAARLGVNGDDCRRHLRALREFRDADPDAFNHHLGEIYRGRDYAPIRNPERMLYSGGFFNDADKRLMEQVRQSNPEGLTAGFPFTDQRLQEILFRYRARNFPETLSDEERARWEEYRFAYLTDPEQEAPICLEEYNEIIETLLLKDLSPNERKVLEELLDYGDRLLADGQSDGESL